MPTIKQPQSGPGGGEFSRRAMIAGGAAALGGTLLPATLAMPAWAADSHPAIGTYPDGVSGSSVFIGLTLPLTGTYAASGEDERKGFELAIEHLNTGNAVIRMYSPHIKTGVLGKQIKFGVADTQAKPNTAVQAQTRFISENKAILTCGSVSSAVAVACNKTAQAAKVLYLPGISGSNDTTGKDCVRYCFRTCDYAETAARALVPILVKQLGRNLPAAYITPDYTYGHTVFDSVSKAAAQEGGWTVATNQVAPLGAPDFNTYLLNIANSGAKVLVNIGFGNDAVISIKQAQQLGILDKMTLVMPYNTPFLAKEVTPQVMQGVYATTEFWWTMGEKNAIAKAFVDAFDAKYGYKPEWSAHSGYLQLALWADAVERAGTFYPPDVIKSYEKGVHYHTDLGEVWFRPEDHQLVRPVVVVRGKKPSAMKSADDYYDIVELVPGEGLMQAPGAFGCKLGPYT
jgi:ABC-type branched-subunit amino acid transport system substrate-binding protein